MPASPRSVKATSAMLRALAEPASYGASGPVIAHETHASWVFVAGGRAYKVKKPLVLPFLDYGTLERRRAACREEVRVNRELAPGLYLGVRAIVRRDGGFTLVDEDCAGAVEYAVEMRAFDERDTLAGLIAAGALRAEHLEAVAARIAEFHRDAATFEDHGGAPEMRAVWRANLEELDAALRQLGAARPQLSAVLAETSRGTVQLHGFADAFLRAHEHEIEERRRAGLVRDGHGDLRCEHVLAVPQVRIVDRIEFDPSLRRTDVACDLAFLEMDLEALGQRWASEQLAAAYERHGGDPGGAALRAFHQAHWALVRAKVRVIAALEATERRESAEQLGRATAHLALAERLCWRARMPAAVLVCGPAASGKSTLAAELARRSGMALLSSDALRKAAAGVAATERAPAGAYSARFTQLTYARLGEQGAQALEGGGGVIIDATARRRAERGPVIDLLRRPGVSAIAARCSVPLEVAVRRAELRAESVSPSDATPEIAAEQHAAFEELDELDRELVVRVDTLLPIADQMALLARAIDGRLVAAASRQAQALATGPSASSALEACR
jgi:uncharacterized protein